MASGVTMKMAAMAERNTQWMGRHIIMVQQKKNQPPGNRRIPFSALIITLNASFAKLIVMSISNKISIFGVIKQENDRKN